MSLNVTEDISVPGRVLAALTRMNMNERRVAIRRLRNENRRATIEAVTANLDNPDESVRISAAQVLPIAGSTPDTIDILIKQLRSNRTPQVRSASARELARTESIEAADAVLAALDDPDDEVVEAACDFLARWGGRPAIEGLLHALVHRSWCVRLRACTALMDLGVCSARVMAALEMLSHEPEAVEHDQNTAAVDADIEERCGLVPAPNRIGPMREIVDRAKRMHMRTVRLAA